MLPKGLSPTTQGLECKMPDSSISILVSGVWGQSLGEKKAFTITVCKNSRKHINLKSVLHFRRMVLSNMSFLAKVLPREEVMSGLHSEGIFARHLAWLPWNLCTT